MLLEPSKTTDKETETQPNSPLSPARMQHGLTTSLYGNSFMILDRSEATYVAEEPPCSPLSPTRLWDLYFRPKNYFANARYFSPKNTLLIPMSLMGIARAMERVDQRLAQAQLGYASKSWNSSMSWLLASWGNYWLGMIFFGLVGAVCIWYLGGWWYKKRLQWSGANALSSAVVRRVFTMQELVLAGPTVLIALVQTGVFSNYREAWLADESWSSVIIMVFAFWACWTSYVAATTAFQVSKSKARIWFLILPLSLYATTLGLAGALLAIANRL